jgi:hypothetical protein
VATVYAGGDAYGLLVAAVVLATAAALLLRTVERRRAYPARHRWDTPSDPWAAGEAYDPMRDTAILAVRPGVVAA